jgi:Kef-type K+ transport system membrane component KefB
VRRSAALLLVLAVAWLITSWAPPAGLTVRGTGLALGFTLIAAALVGELFERVRLPRVTGYLLFGLLAGPYLGHLLTSPMARELQLVNGVAVALIAFIAGVELNLSRLRPRLAAVVRFGGVTIALMWVGLFAVFLAAWPWLPIVPDATGYQRVALAALLSTITVSFSPTVTIAVIAESRARGPLSELALSLVVLGDLALILIFTFTSELVRQALGGGVASGLISGLAWEILGSLAFGAIVGAGFAFYLRYVGRELTLVLLVVCVLLSEVANAFDFESLLAALAAGLVVENLAAVEGDALKNAVERGALPVLVIFFAAAGANLQLDALAEVGLMAVAVSLVRLAFIRVSTTIGRRAAGLDTQDAGLAWMALISQAGVTLGLTMLVAREFPGWGSRLATFSVALVALHEMAGPILFRTALARAGEVGQMDVNGSR